MYCSICHRYSSNPGEVNSKVFSINGYQRTFTVCKDKPHSEEQRILTDMVNKQEQNKEIKNSDKVVKNDFPFLLYVIAGFVVLTLITVLVIL